MYHEFKSEDDKSICAQRQNVESEGFNGNEPKTITMV